MSLIISSNIKIFLKIMYYVSCLDQTDRTWAWNGIWIFQQTNNISLFITMRFIRYRQTKDMVQETCYVRTFASSNRIPMTMIVLLFYDDLDLMPQMLGLLWVWQHIIMNQQNETCDIDIKKKVTICFSNNNVSTNKISVCVFCAQFTISVMKDSYNRSRRLQFVNKYF